jgi:hypothetical protein
MWTNGSRVPWKMLFEKNSKMELESFKKSEEKILM